MIAPTAEVHETVLLGEDVHVWGGAAIMSGTRIGPRCSIGRHSEIGRDCVIGEGTRIGFNVFMPNGTRIGRGVFIGPGVVFTDDKRPRANNPGYRRAPVTVEDDASIGAAAVILPGVTIGQGSLVGAGAVVTHDVRSHAVVMGNPAREPSAFSQYSVVVA
jgi:acetyltransferase-like isoleucine patch superfamily enzyme